MLKSKWMNLAELAAAVQSGAARSEDVQKLARLANEAAREAFDTGDAWHVAEAANGRAVIRDASSWPRRSPKMRRSSCRPRG
jgi:hypothetical protein